VSRDPSEFILVCWFGSNYVLLLSILRTVVPLNIFVETMIQLLQSSLKNRNNIIYLKDFFFFFTLW